MSIRVMTAVWESAVPSPERFTLLALADSASEEGVCWPSHPTLAKKCRTNERTTRRHVAAMVEAGYVRVEYRAGTSSRYRIDVSRLPADPPETKGHPGQSDSPGQIVPPGQSVSPTPVRSPGDPGQIARGPRTNCPPNRKEPLENHYSAAADASAPAAEASGQQPEKPKEPEPQRDDVDALCARLRDWMIRNDCRPPTVTQEWRRQARLLLDRDKRELSKALNLIDWCQQDEFWAGNIHSIPKFREQYDKLAIRAREEWRRSGGRLGAGPPVAAPTSFEEIRERVAHKRAGDLLGRSFIPRSQPPSDPTPPQQWFRDRALEFIDDNEAAIRAALTNRQAG